MNKIQDILESIKAGCDFQNSQDFIEDGLLDSLDVFALMEALEKEFQIEIRGEDIIPENFKSFESIAELVRSYN